MEAAPSLFSGRDGYPFLVRDLEVVHGLRDLVVVVERDAGNVHVREVEPERNPDVAERRRIEAASLVVRRVRRRKPVDEIERNEAELIAVDRADLRLRDRRARHVRAARALVDVLERDAEAELRRHAETRAELVSFGRIVVVVDPLPQPTSLEARRVAEAGLARFRE